MEFEKQIPVEEEIIENVMTESSSSSSSTDKEYTSVSICSSSVDLGVVLEPESELGLKSDMEIERTEAQPSKTIQLTPMTTPLKSLSQILGKTEQLLFLQTDSVGIFGWKSIVLPILDGNGHRILSVIDTPRQRLRLNVSIGRQTKFTDCAGNILLHCVERNGGIVVTSGDIPLGTINGSSLFSTKITGGNEKSEKIFRVEQKPGDRFTFLRTDNEKEIGSLGYNLGSVCLKMASCDTNTKGLVLVTAYRLFLRHFVETSCGGTGLRRALTILYASITLFILISLCIAFFVYYMRL